ncbi:Spermatogenesis-associated protein 20, partial [Operophtera brumata]
MQWARELQTKQDELFWDQEHAGYYTCSADDATVVLRLKEDQDGAEPSGNSVSCLNLQRLAACADRRAEPAAGELHRDMAKQILQAFAKRLNDMPTALPEMMSALMFYNDSPTHAAAQTLVRWSWSAWCGRGCCRAECLLSRVRKTTDVPTAYVCRRYACSLPVTDVKDLENILDQAPVQAKQK